MSLLSQLRDYELRTREEGQKAAEAGADAGGEMPFMYAMQNVRYVVRLHADGKVRDVQPLSSGKAKGKERGLSLAAPKVKRSGKNFKAQLFMDNAEYALGLVRREGDEGVIKRHSAFRQLVFDCADATNEISAHAVAHFLRELDSSDFVNKYLKELGDFSPDENVTFSVDGIRPIEIPAIQRYWADLFSTEHKGDSGKVKFIEAECLITGKFGPVMNREPLPIKGIAGGNPTGMAFISANNDAFVSYGLKASQIAPVKMEAAVDYANGLNKLLADPATSMRTGGLTYVFWTAQGATLPVGEMLTNEDFDLAELGLADEAIEQKADSGEVRATFSSPYKGIFKDFDPHTAFYAVGMTPSNSRIAVRSHLTSTVGDTVVGLRHYFAAQRMVHLAPWQEGKTYSVGSLARSLFFQKPKKGETKLGELDEPKDQPDSDANGVIAQLIEHALSGLPLPINYLTRLNRRNVAEKRVTRPRAVLTKMVLLSNDFKELDMDKETLDALNPDQKEPAYHLGRLLAVLDDIQGSVMKANTTLVDRFYGSMSTTPYAVVGRLIGGSQAHLQKLRKEKGWLYKIKQEELEDVMGRLKDIPAKPLTTAQQALFALGYYHQRAHISEGKREGSSAKASRDETLNQLTLLNAQGDDKQ